MDQFAAGITYPYAAGQIVKGIVAGTFVILGSRMIDGEEGYQLKAVNPADHTQMAPGELWLPADSVKAI